MAVPKKQTTRSKRGMRRSHDRLQTASLTRCQSCGALRPMHHACPSCGTYRGRAIGSA